MSGEAGPRAPAHHAPEHVRGHDSAAGHMTWHGCLGDPGDCGLSRTRLTMSRARVRTEGRWQRAGAAHRWLRWCNNSAVELQ
jgi:hypothetical protein